MSRFVAACVFACAVGTVHAQENAANYPARPIRLLVGVPAGAGNDTISRAG